MHQPLAKPDRKPMKTISLLAAIAAPLLPLSSSAEQVKISTLVFKTSASVELPTQVRIISKSEWQQTLRTLAQTKGTDLFVTPAAKTSSGKTIRVNLPEQKTAGFWQREDEPVLPVSSIEYTPKPIRGGIELIGNFKLKPGSIRGKAAAGSVTACKVHGRIPKGNVMTFALGGHFFAVEPSTLE